MFLRSFLDDYSFPEQSGTLGDDGITDGEAVLHDIFFPVVLSEERHGGGFCLAIDDTIHKRAVLQLIRRLLRNDDTVRAVCRHDDGRAAAVVQQMAAIDALVAGNTILCFVGTLSSSTPSAGIAFEAVINSISDTNDNNAVATRSLSLTITGAPTVYPTTRS